MCLRYCLSKCNFKYSGDRMILVAVLTAVLVFFCIAGVPSYDDRKLIKEKIFVYMLGILDTIRACIEVRAKNSTLLLVLVILSLSINVIRMCLVIHIYKRSNKIRITPIQGDGIIVYSPYYNMMLRLGVGKVLYAVGVPEEYFNTVEPVRLDRVEGHNTDQTVHAVFKPGDIEYPDVGEVLGIKLFLTREAAEERVKFFRHADCFSTVMARHGYEIEDLSRNIQ